MALALTPRGKLFYLGLVLGLCFIKKEHSRALPNLCARRDVRFCVSQDDFPLPPCSLRTALGNSVLNDHCVSVPKGAVPILASRPQIRLDFLAGTEDGFKSRRTNQYEERMYMVSQSAVGCGAFL